MANGGGLSASVKVILNEIFYNLPQIIFNSVNIPRRGILTVLLRTIYHSGILYEIDVYFTADTSIKSSQRRRDIMNG